MKQTMCVVRKYVVKRPEIEERERERLLLFYYFFGFFEQQQNGLHDGKEERTRKKEKKTKLSWAIKYNHNFILHASAAIRYSFCNSGKRL
jgi:hypothetical protein